jgi:hypothetical protein
MSFVYCWHAFCTFKDDLIEEESLHAAASVELFAAPAHECELSLDSARAATLLSVKQAHAFPSVSMIWILEVNATMAYIVSSLDRVYKGIYATIFKQLHAMRMHCVCVITLTNTNLTSFLRRTLVHFYVVRILCAIRKNASRKPQNAHCAISRTLVGADGHETVTSKSTPASQRRCPTVKSSNHLYIQNVYLYNKYQSLPTNTWDILGT